MEVDGRRWCTSPSPWQQAEIYFLGVSGKRPLTWGAAGTRSSGAQLQTGKISILSTGTLNLPSDLLASKHTLQKEMTKIFSGKCDQTKRKDLKI
jgi:hypothetical protein